MHWSLMGSRLLQLCIQVAWPQTRVGVRAISLPLRKLSLRPFAYQTRRLSRSTQASQVGGRYLQCMPIKSGWPPKMAGTPTQSRLWRVIETAGHERIGTMPVAANCSEITNTKGRSARSKTTRHTSLHLTKSGYILQKTDHLKPFFIQILCQFCGRQ